MAKLNKSHEQNNFHQKYESVTRAQEALLENYKPRMLDPKVLPFFEDWKNNLQNSSRNTNKNIQENILKPASAIDFTASCDIIENNESLQKEVPSFYLHNDYAELCNKYHIPYKAVYHNYRELDATEELVAEYVDLLKDAESLGIYWDTSTFDIQALREAIEDCHDSEGEAEYFSEQRSNRWAYFSSLGVL